MHEQYAVWLNQACMLIAHYKGDMFTQAPTNLCIYCKFDLSVISQVKRACVYVYDRASLPQAQSATMLADSYR